MNIKPLLKKKGISQRELARRLDVDASYVNRMMTPYTSPRFSTAIRIADVLEISLDELRAEIETKESKDEEDTSSTSS